MTLDWKDWRIDFQPHQLLGDPPDSKLINKLRYAIPTSSIASAFGLTELSEKTYRSIKFKMLNWPFTRTLIYAPYSTATKIHGDNTDNWLKVVKTMKPLLLPRTEADDRLKKDSIDTRSPRSTSTPRKTPPRTRSLQTPETDNGNKAIAAALQRQTEMFETMMQKIMETTSNTITQVVNLIGTARPAPSAPIVPESDSRG